MALEQIDNTLQGDVEKALNVYLKIPENAGHAVIQKAMPSLTTKLNMSKDPAAQTSLVFERCPFAGPHGRRMEQLNKALTAQRLQGIDKRCSKMHLEYGDKSWNEYFQGSNNKYPPVSGLKAVLCQDTLIQRMMLFDRLQGERQQNFDIVYPDLSNFEDRHMERAAIIVPSGGKKGDDLGKLVNSTWWSRLREHVHVVLVVSKEEEANYKKIAHVTVVPYTGFGIGCGRAVGIEVAKKLGRICFMTDDRTKDLTQLGVSVGAERMGEFLEDLKDLHWITGVLPRINLNVMTIINPQAAVLKKPTFPRYFIASKEDVSLDRYCTALEAMYPAINCRGSDSEFQVHFDADNPTCTNDPRSYTGDKGETMKKILASSRYVVVDKKTVLNWSYLSGKPGFKNMWDALKLQESAMYQLFDALVTDLGEVDWNAEESVEIKQKFEQHIVPWFS